MNQQLHNKVVRMAKSTISDLETVAWFQDIKNSLSLTEDEIISAWVQWDTGKEDYGNEMYNSHAMRVAMYLHNFLPGSWHQYRQNLISKLVEQLGRGSIYEVGFGTVPEYVDLVLGNNLTLTLSDMDDSSLRFAKLILDIKYSGWNNKIVLQKLNMDTETIPADHDLYIFQDSLEHALDPGKVLSQHVGRVKKGTRFLFSLPRKLTPDLSLPLGLPLRRAGPQLPGPPLPRPQVLKLGRYGRRA